MVLTGGWWNSDRAFDPFRVVVSKHNHVQIAVPWLGCTEVSRVSNHQYEADLEEPPRATTPGRGHGDGRWLEYQLELALHRWGYDVGRNAHVFGEEVDVIAVRQEKQNKPTDWLVAQCKDWATAPVDEDVLYRLCMMAFTCGAMPVLCHTTRLTKKAERIARYWEVRVLTLEDLERGSLPAPNVAKPTVDLETYDPPYTAREERGPLPLPFVGEPNRHLNYVPGFKPVGRSHHYEPIDDDTGGG